jgi:hypothetical protein
MHLTDPPSLSFNNAFASLQDAICQKKQKKKEKKKEIKRKGGKMTLWLRGGEKERMHGYYVCRRFENL